MKDDQRQTYAFALLAATEAMVALTLTQQLERRWPEEQQ